MTGLGFLDLVIGLVFIYFIISIVVSILQEMRANVFRLRAKNLEAWLVDTFQKTKLDKELLQHDLIKTLVKKGRKPAYIPEENFVEALFDIVNQEKDPQRNTYSINELKQALESSQLLPKDLKRYVLQSISEVENKASQLKDEVLDELKEVKESTAKWFNNCMDRVGGTYRNRQQKFILLFSFIVVSAFNADTISLAKYLYTNEDARQALSEYAVDVTEDSVVMEAYNHLLKMDSLRSAGVVDSTDVIEAIKTDYSRFQSIQKVTAENLSLPLGWSEDSASFNSLPLDPWGWILKLVGLLITTLAVSMGSPFWFQILNKLANLKGAGVKPTPKSS